MVQVAGPGGLDHWGKRRQLRIAPAAEPPDEHAAVALRVSIIQARWKPEVVNGPPLRLRYHQRVSRRASAAVHRDIARVWRACRKLWHRPHDGLCRPQFHALA